MHDTGWLWAVFTLIAAASQTARNAMQRELTATLGTVGATHVRFLFGFPFALLSLAGLMLVTGASLPRFGLSYWPWIALGAGAQIAATVLMLAAMGERSFVVTIAYIKTEPIQVALFGLVFLGDKLIARIVAAILIATAGVIVMSLKPGGARSGSWQPMVLGHRRRRDVRACRRSAIAARSCSLNIPDFVMAATFTLAIGLVMQARVLSLYLLLREPEGDARHRDGVAAVAARRLSRRARLAILVPGFCDRDRGQRAHAGAGRGAVRAGDLALRVRAEDDAARGDRHRAGRDRRRCC